MRSTLIAFACGAGCLQLQAALPSLWILLLCIAAAIGLFTLVREKWKTPAFAAGGALLGFAWAALFAQHYLAQELPKEWEGREITIIGTIDSLPYYFERGVRFNFAVERAMAQDDGTPVVPRRLALSWYSPFQADEEDAARKVAFKVAPGERWRLTVRLQRPHGNANPYGFDYEVWSLEQNLRATGTVRADEKSALKNERLDSFVISFGNVVERGRGWLRDHILKVLQNKQYAGVLVALVIGDQRAIAQSDWKIFNSTGIGHLVSISGLHITMIASLFASLTFQLWRRSFFTRSKLPVILPAQKAAALAGVGMALVYVLLAGFGVPAQRTLYMLAVVATALWFGRLTSVSHVLCIALGVVVFLDPWAVLWPGFWLSFGAVAIILYASTGRTQWHAETQTPMPKWRHWMRSLKQATHTQYVITLGLVPLTMLLFGQMSLVSPVANAIAIPLISFVVTPLALLGSVAPWPLSAWVLSSAYATVEWLAAILAQLSAFPAAVWSAPVPALWIFLCACIGTLWLLAPRGWPLRWFGLLGWLPLLLNMPAHPAKGEMWVTAFDVGQGGALLVETSGHRLLYDTGPFYSPESDGGSRVIVPYLKARGIDKLDAVIVSHGDNDHSGGALSIFENIKVGWVSSSMPEANPIAQAAPGHRRCEAGQGWLWNDVRFDMLYPTRDNYSDGDGKGKSNARSCTLKITLGEQSILLAGDIESAQEAELVGSQADNLRASVLLAPHHGSGTSSTLPFLHAVKPGIALFQVGYRNRYHHPKQEVFDRYGALDIQRLRSDESGAVSLRFGPKLEFSEYRKAHARYWHGR